MKVISLSSLIGALCLAATPLVHGKTPPSQSNSLKFDVTVVGRLPNVSGRPNDLFISFSAPVGVPKAMLASGTYIFTQVTPTAVRVTSLDRHTAYAAFPTVQAMRYDDISHAQVRFEREGDGEPVRILEVYPQGSIIGYAPVYARHRKGE